MKIDKVSQPPAGTIASEGKSARPAKSEPETGKTSGMSVQLSSLSTQLQASHSDATNETIDAARVQEIKQAISEGRFQVNAEVVADRLLETVRELLQNRTLQ